MRNEVCNMTINRESLELYAFVTQVLKDCADSYSSQENSFTWSLVDGIYITVEMVSGEGYPRVVFHDAYSKFDKVYQIIGYAHYREYEVVCNF